MKTVNLAYVRILYNYLFGITDDELQENFDMDNPSDRELFFLEARAHFRSCGPLTKQRIIDAMEYILSTPDINFYWRQAIPHDLPIWVTYDKKDYFRDLFFLVTGRNPKENWDVENVIVLKQPPRLESKRIKPIYLFHFSD